MKLNTSKNSKKGFSLVEMLVVIAVIGVLTAIAIPIIGRINEQATIAKDNRNAQAVVTMYNAARAGGFDDSLTVAQLAEPAGVTVTDDITGEITTFKLDIAQDALDDVANRYRCRARRRGSYHKTVLLQLLLTKVRL